MDWDTFWNLNPHFLKAYVEAHRLKQRQREMEMYVQGRYVYDAVSIALANGFSKKNTQPVPWLEEPYRILPYTDTEKAEIAERERLKAVAFFNSMIDKGGKDDNGT